MPYLRQSYDSILNASVGFDLLISHPLTFTLPLVADKLKIPWISTVLAPLSLMSCLDPPVLPNVLWLRNLQFLGPSLYRILFLIFKVSVFNWEKPLRIFRKELNVMPLKHMAFFEGQFSSLRNLALFDSKLAQSQSDWPRNTVVCGAPLYDGDGNLPDDLNLFLQEGAPPIVFALGSVVTWIAQDFWNLAIEACQKLGKRAVLITGPFIPKKLPCEFRAYSYLPYSKIFPHAAIIVHQSGIGTLAHALRSGRTQLMVPNSFDQPDNARRAQLLGIGRILQFKKVTLYNLTSELRILMQNKCYQENARSIADELQITEGAVVAADELVECLNLV